MNSEENTFVYRPTGQLAAALSAAQKDFKAIKKDRTAKVFSKRTNSEFKYNYADLANVIDCIKEALSANGLAYTQPTRITESGLVLTTILMHKSGESVSGDLPIPSGLSPQELGSYLTYMRRYGLCAAVGVSAEEDDDAKASQDSGAKTPPKAEKAAVRAADAQKPAEAPKLVLNLPTGEGKPFGSMTAYLDAFDTEMANVDDQVQFFDLNSATLGEMQAKAVLAKNKAGDAVAQRITEIYDRIRADTPYDPLKGA